MSNYEETAAASFGPILAELAVDEEGAGGPLTPDLIRRAKDAWNLTAAAFEAVAEKATEILAQ